MEPKIGGLGKAALKLSREGKTPTSEVLALLPGVGGTGEGAQQSHGIVLLEIIMFHYLNMACGGFGEKYPIEILA